MRTSKDNVYTIFDKLADKIRGWNLSPTQKAQLESAMRKMFQALIKEIIEAIKNGINIKDIIKKFK